MLKVSEKSDGRPLLCDMGGVQFVEEGGKRRKINVVWFEGGVIGKEVSNQTKCAYREYRGAVLLKERKYMPIEALREKLVYPADLNVDRRMKIQRKKKVRKVK